MSTTEIQSINGLITDARERAQAVIDGLIVRIGADLAVVEQLCQLDPPIVSGHQREILLAYESFATLRLNALRMTRVSVEEVA